MNKRFAGLVGITAAASMLTGCGAGIGDAFFHSKGDSNSATTAESERGNYVTTDNGAKGYYEEAVECTSDEAYYYGGYDYAAPYYGSGEGYAEIVENTFKSVLENPLSTFSADVDTASYANLRRMIMDGYNPEWIDKNAVRIEEMLNYFSYDYKQPLSDEVFSVNAHLAPCPWSDDSYLMMLGLQTEAIDFTNAPASNLVFLIDVSGSMYDDDKLPLLQKSFAMLCTNLTARDRVSIVTYAGSDAVVLEGAKGNETDRIISAIDSLQAGGSTNGSAGIKTAYKLAERYFIEGGNNRVILATDGDLNVGITDNGGLEDLISYKKESGVFLSVLGFGYGNIQDDKMELLADKGNGNYSYIDSLREAKKVLVQEMGATLLTVAKDVKFQLEFDPDVVESYRQIGYENRALADEDFEDDTKDAGEVGAGSSVTVLYEIKLTGNTAPDRADTWTTLHIRYKEPAGDVSTERIYNIGKENYELRAEGDLAFAAAVAEFGMILRDSDYKGDSTTHTVLSLLDRAGIYGDEYKEEFEQLVEMYQSRLY